MTKVVDVYGKKFYMTQLGPKHTVLVPVEDPDWCLRVCDQAAPRSVKNDD
jgi:hypothetical protein